MKAALGLVVIGSAFCAMMGVAGPVRAQTVLMPNLTNGTFTFGNESFTISNLAWACRSCSTNQASIYTVLNGRGGTEIEIAGTNGIGSAIFSETTAGKGSYNLSFNLAVTPNAASGGLSKITDLLTGTATSSGGNSSVLAGITGTGATPFSTVQSTIGANASPQSFSLAKFGTATPSANFAINVGVTATAGQILQLTNVALLFNPAPEPASIALFGTGLAGLAAARRRFRQRRLAQQTKP